MVPEEDYGWNRFLIESVKICDIQSNHFSILYKETIPQVVSAIELHLLNNVSIDNEKKEVVNPG